MLAPDTLLQNRYLIVRPIGQGGMGAVYLAVDQRLGNTIALKETFFNDEYLRRAFEREARLLANLRHPSLPVVSDHFTEGNGQFLVMQFIHGDDLEELLNRRGSPFSPDDVLGWADQLLDALDYLHTQEPPVIHRDIKPQNLKLTARGHIILLDFGLAKGSAVGMSQVSSSGSIFGYTPNYAPLEQIEGAGTDARSDLYSLGATLYHLMTGEKPPDAVMRANVRVNEQPDPLLLADELNPQVSPSVADVLMKAMALKREQRFASAAEMRKTLLDVRERAEKRKQQQLQAGEEAERQRQQLELRITDLEKKIDPVSGHLRFAFNYINTDPHSSLTKSRMVLERLLVCLYHKEMSKEPRRPLLGEILADNQFTRRIERRIVARMNNIREMGNLGPHGEEVNASDANRVLADLCDIVEWYTEKYGPGLKLPQERSIEEERLHREKEEAEKRRQQEEQERRAKEEAERLRQEQERKEREEAERRKQQEEEQRKASEEDERQQREEQQRREQEREAAQQSAGRIADQPTAGNPSRL
jgi:serine/threonine protein kinase